VHRLVRSRPGVDGIDVVTGDVAEQRTMRCGLRRQRDRLAAPLGGGEASGQQAHGGGLDIAFAAGDLSGETQLWRSGEAEGFVEQLRRVEKRVAMQAAEAGEFGALKTRNGAEDTGLRAAPHPAL